MLTWRVAAGAARSGLAGRARLAKQSLIYVAATAANVLVPLLLLPLLTRWLGPADYGVVGTLLAMVNVTAIVVGLGTHGQISVAYFRDGAHSLPASVGATIGVLGVSGAVVLGLLLALGPWIARTTGVSERWTWAVWLAGSGQFFVMMLLAVWQVRQQVWHYAATQVGFTALGGALTVVLVGGAGMGWPGRAAAQAAAAAVAILVGAASLTRAGLVEWHPRKWAIRDALAFGIPLLPHSLAAVALGTVDRFALSGNAAPAAVGHYFAAFQIGAVLTLGASALNQAWVPWLYARLARADDPARREVVQTTYVVYALLLGAGALTALLAPTVVRAVAGAAFAPAGDLLRLLAPAAAFSGMYYFVSGYLFYHGRTGLLSVITVSTAAVQAALSFALARADGARGVATATLASSCLYWFATSIAAQRVAPMPWAGGRTARGGA